MARKKRGRALKPAETRFEAFAEDLGSILGSAQNKAESWLGQRKAILAQLSGVRDAAARLIAQLTDDGGKAGRGRHARAAANGGPRKRRKLSAAGRAAIVAAQKARWAKLRQTEKKRKAGKDAKT